jgi:hypothetical protein
MDRDWRREDAASPILAFLIASALFVGTFTYLVFESTGQGQDSEVSLSAQLSSQAANLADLLVATPGLKWYSSDACESGIINATKITPDAVGVVGSGRFGLGREPCGTPVSQAGDVHQIDYNKLIDLNSALMQADATNNHLDYEEARRSLGLDKRNLDFHVRTEPVLENIRQILKTGYKDPNLKPLYLGDYEAQSGGAPVVRVVQKTSGVVSTSENATLWVHITNNGSVPTVFEVAFRVPLKDATVELLAHTDLVAASGTFNVTTVVRKTADWQWANTNNKKVNFTITDPAGSVGSGSIDLSGITMTHASTRKLLHITADKLSFLIGQSGSVNAKVHYESRDGKGNLVNNNDWRMKVLNPDNSTFSTVSLGNKKSGFEQFSFSTAGTYKARLENSAGSTLLNLDLVNVVSSAIGDFTPSGGSGTYKPQASVAPEIAYIDAIIENFDPYVFSNTYDNATVPYQAGGDVLPDIKKVMNNDLPARLTDASGAVTTSKHNVLFVGSNVHHNSMTSAAAKQTIRDWVYAGGLLIVLGSTEQTVNWLQPIFHTAIDGAGGGISTPDENHPILTTPNRLDYESFNTHDIVWQFNRQQDADLFTHVVTESQGDYMAVSNPGDLGEGRVILTSYQPFDLVDGQAADCTPGAFTAECPALQLVHNLMSIGYSGLYVDYGPKLPHDREHGSVIRIGAVDHPQLATRIALRVYVYIF